MHAAQNDFEHFLKKIWLQTQGSKAVPALNPDRGYLVVNSQGRDGLATLCLSP
jgi:hypothetical protein